jgi:RpiR family carbohydrate utilization transcriptional regulator
METGHIFSTIRTKYNILSDSQKRVADYVLANGDTVMISSLSDLSMACDVSEPTVLRFLKKLGCDSYQVFRVNIAQALSNGGGESLYEDVKKDDTTDAVVSKVLHSTSQAIMDAGEIIDAASVERFVEKIHSARFIYVIGMGASAAQAYDFTHKMLKLGLRVEYCHDSHLINIRCSSLTAEDLLIAFSHSGESREILDGIAFAKHHRCPVLAITSYHHSSLARAADAIILSSSQETRYRSDAMISRIIQMTIIDMIYVKLALLMGDAGMDAITRSRLAVAKNKT